MLYKNYANILKLIHDIAAIIDEVANYVNCRILRIYYDLEFGIII